MTWRRHLLDARRLSFWKAPRFDHEPLPASAVLLIFGLTMVGQIIDQFLLSKGMHYYSIYGTSSIIAFGAVVAALIIIFTRVDPTQSARRSLVLIYLAASIVCLVSWVALGTVAPSFFSPTPFHLIAAGVVSVGSVIWMSGAVRQAFRRPGTVRRPTLRAVAFVMCLYLVALVFPFWPVFAPDSFEPATANGWEVAHGIWSRRHADKAAEAYAAEWLQSNEKAARIESQQPGRLDAALAAVAPRDAGKPNIFLVGVSGWSDLDVFVSETEQSLQILKSRFDIGNRVVKLVNAQDTVNRYPIASIQNLSSVLRGIGTRMDREKDVLILAMTSHGSEAGLALSFDNLLYRSLDPSTLKTLLDDAGIKNRILIVGACHSGVFVPTLADDDTMIVTAASATKTSFGCASGRIWTYFGDAFFAHGLGQKPTLAEAFAVARKTIAKWEQEQQITPSNPQIFVGKAIARRFPAIVGETQREAMLPPGGSPAVLQ